MNCFNVIVEDFNSKKFEAYDIMPYLRRCYIAANPKPKTFDEFMKLVDNESMYQFWGRCEYEVILVDWPSQTHEEKIDVYWQIKMNISLITKLLMEDVEEIKAYN